MALSSRYITGCLFAAFASALIASSEAKAAQASITDQNQSNAIAMAGVSSLRGAGVVTSAHAPQAPTQPKVWMLVGVGVFLIGAVSHRRISSNGT